MMCTQIFSNFVKSRIVIFKSPHSASLTVHRSKGTNICTGYATRAPRSNDKLNGRGSST